MLTIPGTSPVRLCDGLPRRDFLRIGALGLGGMALADLLRRQARGGARTGPKAVIYVYLWGGPSHIDTYDMKPDAPVEYRGEFKPIRTNVPGFDICELMPLQAKIADKLALVRNLKFNPNFHDPVELFSGYRKPAESGSAARPDFGSVVSKLRGGRGHALPAYVALDKTAGFEFRNGPAYLGLAHKAFVPGEKLESLTLRRGFTLDRLHDRQMLLRSFDQMRRDLDAGQGVMDGMDSFTAKAFEMVTSPRVRDAFDVGREPERLRARYGEGEALRLLQARRLVEAGVPVVTLTFGGVVPNEACKKDNISATSWDTHNHGFPCLRAKLPRLDRAVYALITDLHARGMGRDVTVMIGGEMGRYPVVGKGGCGATPDGRGHWTHAGFSLISGGGMRMGQVIGRTDKRGERPVGKPYTPQNLLATLYKALGVDLTTTLPDHSGRPMPLLDDFEPIKELL